MKLSRILLFAAAAWAGTVYYNKYQTVKHVTSSGGLFPGGQIAQPGPSATGLRAMDRSIGQVGGLGRVGTEQRMSGLGGLNTSSSHSSIDTGGSLTLIKAAAKGDTKMVSAQLEEHVKVDGRDDERRTAIMYASWNGHDDICTRLLLAGANPALRDRNGHNAFDFAAGRGLIQTVKLLLQQSNSPDKNHVLEYATLMEAALSDAPARIPAGKGTLASINRIGPERQSPLHIAASSGSVALAEALTKRGAKVNLENGERQTPLHWAAWSNQPQMITWLADHGADLSRRDMGGNTPLVLAVQNKSLDAVKILLSRGATKNVANKEGKTALIIAEESDYAEAVGLLK